MEEDLTVIKCVNCIRHFRYGRDLYNNVASLDILLLYKSKNIISENMYSKNIEYNLLDLKFIVYKISSETPMGSNKKGLY